MINIKVAARSVKRWQTLIDANNPASNNVPNPNNEEDLELVEYEDIYCDSKSKTINNMVNNDPLPPDNSPFKPVADVQLDTLKTYMQVKFYLSTIP